MNKVILDASALLALIKNEPGAHIIEGLLGHVLMSSINVSEVAATILSSNMSEDECKNVINPFIYTIAPFDTEQCFHAAFLKQQTMHLGLSLGDRACLALGISTGFTVYTADKIWSKLQLDCKIVLIR